MANSSFLHWSADRGTKFPRSRMSSASAAKAPRHWPAVLQYIDAYHFHVSATPTVRQFVQGTPSGKAGNHTPRALVAIRLVADTAHPACGQYGLFAARKIRPRSHILDYIGTDKG